MTLPRPTTVGTSSGSRYWQNQTSVLSPKYEVFCCDQNGPPARRSEPDWRMEGAYLNRYVTDEKRSRRPIFIATKYLVFRGQDTSTRVRSSIVEGVTGFLNSPSFKDQTS